MRIAIRLTTISALAAACVLIPVASASAGAPVFGPPIDLSEPGHTAEEPQVAVDANGNALAVWRDEHAGNYVVTGASRPAGGAFERPVEVSKGVTNTHEPRVAFDPSGDALVVWAGRHTNWIMESALRLAGGGFGTPQGEVSAPGADAMEPQVAFDPSGNALVVWKRSNGTNIIVESSFRPSGGSFEGAVRLSNTSYTADRPQVAFDAAGNALVVWARYDPATRTRAIEAASRPAGRSSSFKVAEELPSAGTGANEPQVAFDTSGNALVVWDALVGGYTRIESSFRPAGKAFEAVVQPSGDSGHNAFEPQVAFDAKGNALAVWTHNNETENVVEASLRQTRPGSFGSPLVLKDVGEEGGRPRVAFDAAGNALAVWEREPTSKHFVVEASFYPAGGTFETSKELSTEEEYSQEPQLALAPSGEALVAWTRYNGTEYVAQAAIGVPVHTLRVSTSGSGTVSGSEISCPGTCSHEYPQGTVVTLTAMPAGGYAFTGWSGGGCSGTGICDVTMSCDRAVTATFTAIPAKKEVSVEKEIPTQPPVEEGGETIGPAQVEEIEKEVAVEAEQAAAESQKEVQASLKTKGSLPESLSLPLSLPAPGSGSLDIASLLERTPPIELKVLEGALKNPGQLISDKSNGVIAVGSGSVIAVGSGTAGVIAVGSGSLTSKGIAARFTPLVSDPFAAYESRRSRGSGHGKPRARHRSGKRHAVKLQPFPIYTASYTATARGKTTVKLTLTPKGRVALRLVKKLVAAMERRNRHAHPKLALALEDHFVPTKGSKTKSPKSFTSNKSFTVTLGATKHRPRHGGAGKHTRRHG